MGAALGAVVVDERAAPARRALTGRRPSAWAEASGGSAALADRADPVAVRSGVEAPVRIVAPDGEEDVLPGATPATSAATAALSAAVPPITPLRIRASRRSPASRRICAPER
jgi:hypothetical protein